jgi:3-deoxy-7-phosphoheptulonate synthase
MPPLVSPSETAHLSELVANLAQTNTGFIVQGGDCAEMFCDCQPTVIDAKVALLKEMSDIVRSAAGHVITIGRIAGQVPLFIMLSKPEVSYIFHQYSKPRSSDTEVTSDGDVIQSYRYFAFAE